MIENILDDREKFYKIDKSRMISHVDNFADMAKEAVNISESTNLDFSKNDFNKIVIAGMGGSAISADIANSILANKLNVPIFIIRNYDVPRFADSKTLFIIISYSGNTEEALSVYKEAVSTGGKIVAITSGGELEKLSISNKNPAVKIPGGLPPRAALPYLLFPLFKIFDKLNVVQGIDSQIKDAVKTLETIKKDYCIDNSKNTAKKLAYELKKKVPIVLGSILCTDAAALRWKTQFNENSKTTALFNIFPELNHNELVNLASLDKEDNIFSLIILRDNLEKDRIRLRIDSTKEILKNSFPIISEFFATGETALARMLSLIYLGDYASVYLAVLKNIDPTPVVPIDLLKKELM